MKKIIATIVMSLVAAAAFALPRPSQIEDELANRDFQSARVHVQQVLDEKPNSAKAHLFNAYILLKADRNPAAASEELKTARRLDKNGDVKNSALFGRTVALLESTPAARPQPVQRRVAEPVYQPAPVVYQAPVSPAKQSSGGLGFWGWLLIAGVAGMLIWFLCFHQPAKRAEAERQERVVRHREIAAASDRVLSIHREAEVAPIRTVYVRPTASVPSRAEPEAFAGRVDSHTTIINNGGSRSGGNDMLTGMLLNEAMHSHGHSHRSDDYDRPARVVTAPSEYSRETYSTPEPAPSRTSYEDTRPSFSSGRDSDSWTPSSSPSSDSPSSWDSGSSGDSGGGGGWD